MRSDSFWDRGGNVKRSWINHINAFEAYVNTIDFLFEVAIVYMLPNLRACFSVNQYWAKANMEKTALCLHGGTLLEK